AVATEDNRLEGVVVRGALIAGLTTHAEAQEEGDGDVPEADEASQNGEQVRVRRLRG
ncbi:MAG: hypothetical protein AVDCRST_MAG05-4091, partial [uncultured Rubrobacteraceae bacterium]